ncbi:thioredoxin domain-containing protein [Brevibacterium album]|uniref:thioredoxin domain-containing protein n=1 Tax=Brevibacterium album TaxID=417948 RepID=UPI000402F42A|nr:DUF255 domain-containing protein [Brevibacterium album]
MSTQTPEPGQRPADNRLGSSTSPYLLQHADNPVDWRQWGPEAFAEAAERDVPVMVSIGYSTCHWCHVMAAESFSDPVIGRRLREAVVAVKVDREELPGVDAHFMDALLAMRGQGGWPLTVFTTPQARPFFAGTYFPPEPRQGMPGFGQVIGAVSRTWSEQRERAEEIADSLQERLSRVSPLDVGLPVGAGGRGAAGAGLTLPAAPLPDPDSLTAAVESLLSAEDTVHGGFGTAPKFPPLMALIQLLRRRERFAGGAAGEGGTGEGAGGAASGAADEADQLLGTVRRAFAGMASGGLRDHVGGGIARYSVDARWDVPHFEKMLYDNALHLRAAAAWHRAERSREPRSRFARLARREAYDTAAFLLAELRLPDGTFAAALDADSLDDRGEHSEGAYYLEADLPAARSQEAEAVGADAGGADNAEEHPVETSASVDTASAPVGGERGPVSPFVLLEAVEAADPARAHPVGVPAIRDWVFGEHTAGSASRDLAPWERPAAESVRRALAVRRQERARPGRDDKAVSEWNALAVIALAEAAEEFAEPEWASAAARACAAILKANTDDGGRLLRSSTHGLHGPGAASLADVAGMLAACLTVLRAGGEAGGRPAGVAPAGGGRPAAARAGADTAAGDAAARDAAVAAPDGSVGGEGVAGADLQAHVGPLLRQALSFVQSARAEDGTLHTVLFDCEGDGIVPARGSDPLDGSQPSGRSALTEALRLVLVAEADLGLEEGASAGGDSGQGALDGGGLTAEELARLRRLLVFSAAQAMAQAARSAAWMLAEAELLVAEQRNPD